MGWKANDQAPGSFWHLDHRILQCSGNDTPVNNNENEHQFPDVQVKRRVGRPMFQSPTQVTPTRSSTLCAMMQRQVSGNPSAILMSEVKSRQGAQKDSRSIGRQSERAIWPSPAQFLPPANSSRKIPGEVVLSHRPLSVSACRKQAKLEALYLLWWQWLARP